MTFFCLDHMGLLARGKRPNDAPLTLAAGCLKFGVRKKTFFFLGHMGLLTRGRRGFLEFGKEKDSVIWGS